MAADVIISVTVTGSNRFQQLSQSILVFQANLWEGSSGAEFPVDQPPQHGLPLDGAVEDPHHRAGRKTTSLMGVYVVGNHQQLGLLVLHQSGDCIVPAQRTGGLLVGTSLYQQFSSQDI